MLWLLQSCQRFLVYLGHSWRSWLVDDLSACTPVAAEFKEWRLSRSVEHVFDLFVGEAVHRLYGDVGGDAGGLFLGGDGELAVGVQVETDCDLGHAGGHGGDAGEFDFSEAAAVGGEFAFALHDVQVQAEWDWRSKEASNSWCLSKMRGAHSTGTIRSDFRSAWE